MSSESTNIWYLGESLTFNVTLRDPETNEAIDVSTLDNLIAFVIHKKTGAVVQQFSIEEKESYEAIVVEDGSNGILSFELGNDITEDMQEGEYIIEIKYWADEKPTIEKGFLGRFVSASTRKVQLT